MQYFQKWIAKILLGKFKGTREKWGRKNNPEPAGKVFAFLEKQFWHVCLQSRKGERFPSEKAATDTHYQRARKTWGQTPNVSCPKDIKSCDRFYSCLSYQRLDHPLGSGLKWFWIYPTRHLHIKINKIIIWPVFWHMNYLTNLSRIFACMTAAILASDIYFGSKVRIWSLNIRATWE